jgi:hypothetical protein
LQDACSLRMDNKSGARVAVIMHEWYVCV